MPLLLSRAYADSVKDRWLNSHPRNLLLVLKIRHIFSSAIFLLTTMRGAAVTGLLIVVILVAAGAGYLIARNPGISSDTIHGSTIPMAPPNWSYQGLASAVINSSNVNPHVTNSYYYFIMRYGAVSSGNGTQLFADVYVVRAQTVAGNWTTGYTVTLTGRQILNVTVQYAKPSTYNVTGVTVTNLADQSNQGSFDETQKQAIGVALANRTVKADISGLAYFVGFVDSQVNSSAPGYWVQISQVNGYRNVGVLVSSDLMEVLKVVTSTSYPNLGAP